MLIGPDGRIEAVGPNATIPTPPDTRTTFFPEAALLPGLVNSHTHLELTGIGDSVSAPSFFDWIQHIRRTKEKADRDWFLDSARRGVRDAWRFGTTTVADTGDSGAVVQALTELGGAGVVYHEAFGPHPDQTRSSMEALTAALGRLRDSAGPRVRVGVSPHAPYTVSAELYRLVGELAGREGLPVALHLAESAAESDLVVRGTGPFASAWAKRGIPLPLAAGSPVDYVQRTGILECAPLVIHGVRVNAGDARVLARANASIALCPMSNRKHGHGDPPVAGLLEAGLRCGVGTDSVASVGSLDLFREARLAVHLGGLTAWQGIELLTRGGAAALGLDQEIGSLAPGRWGDVCVVALGGVEESTIARSVLATQPDDILRTYGAGRCLYARPEPGDPHPSPTRASA